MTRQTEEQRASERVLERITDAAWTAMIKICDEIGWNRSLIDDDKAKATMRAWIIDALKKPAA